MRSYESASCEVFNSSGNPEMLLVCDHASNFIPQSLDGLGLSDAQQFSHIAWDIGIAEVTKGLAVQFDVPAVLSRFSRLVIDPNRPKGSRTLIPEMSENDAIPGNKNLTPVERRTRIDQFYRPYHEALTATLDNLILRCGSSSAKPAVICMHSFTPVYAGEARPWQIGVLWNRDDRLANPLITNLRKGGFVVGDNEPYSARGETGYTLQRLCDSNQLPGVMIEVRQDLIDSAEAVTRWIGILSEALDLVRSELAAAESRC